MPDKLEDMLGAGQEEQPAGNPLEATPDGAPEGENPLEVMDEISKSKPDKKKQGSKDLDEDTITKMLMTGENTAGMFEPDEEKPKDGEPDLHEEVDDKAKVKVGSKAEPKGKYENMFKKDLLKNPNEYKIQTPKGEMTVAEAIRKGYNPLTKRFEAEHDQDKIKEEQLGKLNDADRASLEKFTSPSNAQVAPADAEMYGLKPGSAMIKQPEEANPMAAMTPPVGGAPTPDMGGGMPMPPAGGAGPMPAGPEAGGQPDLAAMLGGGL